MAIMRSLLSYPLLISLLHTTSLCEQPHCDEKSDQGAFQQLLSQVDPPSLHAALHDFSPKKFSHGMFPEDRTAVEAIHKEEPGLATGILKLARLARRQDNGTVPTTTVVAPAPTTTVNASPVPVGPQTSAVVVTSQAPAASQPAANSPTSSAAPAPARTSSPPVAGQSSRTSQAQAPASSSPTTPAASRTSGAVFTTTDSQGRVIVSTVGGGAITIAASQATASDSQGAQGSPITSYFLQTSTLPNGEQSTLTAITVIDGGAADAASATAKGTRSSSAQPGLQTSEATIMGGCAREMAIVLGAAIGVAFML